MVESDPHLTNRLGIHQIRTPNPFSSIETNCYLIDGSIPTLIDSGIATEEAYQALANELSRLGRRVLDIKRILLTHGHADHRALAPRIQAESGAEVFYHRAEHTKVLVADKQEPYRRAGIEFFRSLGVPEELIEGLVDGPADPPIKPKLYSATPFQGGEEILLDTIKLRVIHTPGHSYGSVCFFNRESGLLFSGDTLLPSSRITALIELGLTAGNADYNPLKLHLKSLQLIERLNPKRVLPGHGEMFEDYRTIHEQVRERHEKRQTHILRALRREPKTLYQICRSVFLFHSRDELYLSLSEILGNVGLLLEKQMIRRQQDGNVFVYERI